MSQQVVGICRLLKSLNYNGQEYTRKSFIFHILGEVTFDCPRRFLLEKRISLALLMTRADRPIADWSGVCYVGQCS